jgi:hypothetical protein
LLENYIEKKLEYGGCLARKLRTMFCFIFCRQKTAEGFAIPGVAASPPTFVSLEEIVKAANGFKNMALAHEIAVDKDFRLQKYEPPNDR